MSTPAISSRIPFADLLGVDIVSATKEQIEARMLVRPDMCNPAPPKQAKPSHW
ncbi:MAG: hypothetical protein IPO30_14710 [Hyphomonadaceae bacterium]|nr:hypothetical protein [Hyphomonadaceae bacterium]